MRQALQRSITPQSLGAITLDAKASKDGADALGDELLAFRERWLLYSIGCRRHHLVMGHFAYTSAIPAIGEDYLLVTLLREPRHQLISQFFYNRDKAQHDHFGIDPAMSLKAFLHTETARDIGAKYVQYFTEPGMRARAWEPDALASALENLSRLDAVGTLERVDVWASHLSALLGRAVVVGRENASPTPDAERDAEIDGEALALADELCQPNRAMYDHALQLEGAYAAQR